MCENKTTMGIPETVHYKENDAERLETAARAVSTVWQGVVRAIEEVAGSFGGWLQSVAAEIEAQHEMETALRWASVDNRPLYNRYRHAKKKRIRKKYAKRILEWYRAEVVRC